MHKGANLIVDLATKNSKVKLNDLMKSFILLQWVSLMTLQVLAQTKIVNIHGVVNDTTVKSIEITHPVDAKLIKWENANLKVINGAFNTTMQIPCPVPLGVSYGDKSYTKNYVYANTKMLIDTGGNLHIIGSAMQDEYENEFLPFFRINGQLFDTLQSFMRRNDQKFNHDWPNSINDSANDLREKYYHQRVELLLKYIKLHPNSYVALWDIDYYLTLKPIHKYFNFEKLFSTFSPQMQHQPFMRMMKEKLKESNRLEIGMEFPQDFFIGNEQIHSKIKKNNQYYLIDFWFSHCGPCIEGFSKLKEIYNRFYSKGFDIVSISVDKQKDKEDYFAQIKKNKLLWNLIWDRDGATSYKFNINVFPTYVLVDKNDKIINSFIQVSQLEDFLKKNL